MKFVTVILFLLLSRFSSAQYARFNSGGEIEYEMRINKYERTKKILGDEILEIGWSNYLQSLSQEKFQTQNYVLIFNNSISLFKPIEKKIPTNNLDFVVDIPSELLFTDFIRDSVFIKKNIAGDIVNILDKSIPIIWKFTDERMNILGYECRRANGLVYDSVYVVAFYCQELTAHCGPSIFHGLPGVILGISLPYDNINIFAKKILIKDISISTKEIDMKSGLSFGEYVKFIANLFSFNEKTRRRLKYNFRVPLL